MLRKILTVAATVAVFAAVPALAEYDYLVYRTQAVLADRGFYAGTPDGDMGPRTRAAIQAYQRQKGLPATGQPSEDLFTQIESDTTTRAAPASRAIAPARRVKCADMIHQARPGGTDYRGPPVAGCPPYWDSPPKGIGR